MSGEKFQQQLARLRTLVAINDARVMSNPKHYLKKMDKRCNELLQVLEKVENALSPDLVFDHWEQNCDKNQIPRAIDFQGEALLRCNTALKILRDYRY